MLNEEQKQTVEDNHSLIYWYAHKHGLNLDEWYDLLAIELCYAVLKYNPQRSSLSNYYKMRCDGLVLREKRKQMSKKRFHHSVAFEDEIHNDERFYLMEDVYVKEAIDSHEYGNIIKMKYDGFTQQEIADIIGVSQSYISNLLKKVRQKYYEDN